MTAFPQRRPAMPADAGAISRLITSYSPFAPGTPGRDAFFHSISAQGILERLARPEYRFLVALREGEIAGVISMRDWRHVAFLFVDQASHGQGIGRALWDDMRALALAAGHAGPFLVNADLNAVPFYQRLGFAVCGGQAQSLGVACMPMSTASPKES